MYRRVAAKGGLTHAIELVGRVEGGLLGSLGEGCGYTGDAVMLELCPRETVINSNVNHRLSVNQKNAKRGVCVPEPGFYVRLAPALRSKF